LDHPLGDSAKNHPRCAESVRRFRIELVFRRGCALSQPRRSLFAGPLTKVTTDTKRKNLCDLCGLCVRPSGR
jgi:hypothetical protein